MNSPNYSGFEAVIGLEVHAQLATKSKLFSEAPNDFGAEPNSHINEVCTAQPGTLPVVNKQAVELAIRAGLALNCEVQYRSVWARKNYFYPDLPKGYQLTQFEFPICLGGKVNIQFENEKDRKETKTIQLTRIHMEEDAGKSTHMASYSLLDLNRAGTPLIEIVSDPDFRSPYEASAYLRKLRAILQYTEVCDGNMQEGNLRCDANISIRPYGAKELGTRTELKNLNSFRFIEKAIEYEIYRQVGVIQSGGKIVQETRLYDSAKNITQSMRSKENEQDYRYFPDPDLPPLIVSEEKISQIRASLPELPEQKANRFIQEFSLTAYDASVLTMQKQLAAYFEAVVEFSDNNPKLAANWVMSELLRKLNESETEIEDCRVSAKDLGDLIRFIVAGEISSKIAKVVFEEMWNSGKDAKTIIAEKGLKQESDPEKLSALVREVIEQNPDNVAKYRAGKEKLFAFFVGQVMKATKGKANPQLVNSLIQDFLKGDKE